MPERPLRMRPPGILPPFPSNLEPGPAGYGVAFPQTEQQFRALLGDHIYELLDSSPLVPHGLPPLAPRVGPALAAGALAGAGIDPSSFDFWSETEGEAMLAAQLRLIEADAAEIVTRIRPPIIPGPEVALSVATPVVVALVRGLQQGVVAVAYAEELQRQASLTAGVNASELQPPPPTPYVPPTPFQPPGLEPPLAPPSVRPPGATLDAADAYAAELQRQASLTAGVNVSEMRLRPPGPLQPPGVMPPSIQPPMAPWSPIRPPGATLEGTPFRPPAGLGAPLAPGQSSGGAGGGSPPPPPPPPPLG